MKKILLLGKDGQIGWELQRTLAPLGSIYAFGKDIFNLAALDTIRSKVREIRPDIIVNAAAYTAVDRAEEERDRALVINGVAPGVLAEEAKRLNSILIHYSTDYVFDGSKRAPYIEEDKVGPLNRYGETKQEGELAITAVGGQFLIFRTSWVYGLRGSNFLLTMLKLAQEKKELRIVNDQVGAPTWSRLIAEATAQILTQHKNKWGLYHLTSSGETSWFEFAKKIFGTVPLQQMPNLIPISSKEYSSLAKRPLYSILSNNKINRDFDIVLPAWSVGLELCLDSQEKPLSGKQ